MNPITLNTLTGPHNALAGPIVPATPAQVSELNLMTRTEFSKSGTTYVVMDRHRSTMLRTPGLKTPFHTRRKKYADYVAKEADGVVEDLLDAIKLVACSACNLPKDNPHYSPDPRVKFKL